MATYLIPLQDILTDPDHPADLTALPQAEAIERIKQTYGYWGTLIDVRIENGVAIIDLPDENANKAGAALDKIAQASKAGRAGRWQQAQMLYQDALKVLPQHTEARRELAMVQMELGQASAARQNLIRVLQLDPKDAHAYLILGNLYLGHEHDLGSAERYYAAAAGLLPDDPYILNSYAGLLGKRGRYAEAVGLFERAIAANPGHINPYLGLATVAGVQGDVDGTLASLDRLFDLPHDADARSQPVYSAARRLYADAVRRRAERDEPAAEAELRAAMDAYTARTGIEIRVVYDAAIQSDAVTKLAWRYNRPYHEIVLAGGGRNPYLVAYSYQRIRAEEALRSAGASRLFGTNDETEERALRSIEKELRRSLERRRLGTANLVQMGLSMVQSLMSQLYNMPFDLFLQGRLHQNLPGLRDAQFVGVARQMANNLQAVSSSEERDLVPERLWRARGAMNAALALLIDDLYAGRTAYAEAYRPAGVMTAAARLYAMYRELAAAGTPGAEYALVDAWAGELGLGGWYVWRADTSLAAAPAGSVQPQSAAEEEPVGHRSTPEADAKRVGGATNPGYLELPEVQMTARFYLLAALQRFARLPTDKIFAVAGEIAVLGMNGIDYMPGEKKYTLRNLPGEEFSGLELLCLEYVGFQLTRPEIDTMIPFDAAYRSARAMFESGTE